MPFDNTEIQFCNNQSVRGRTWEVRDRTEVDQPPAGVHPLAAGIVAARGFDLERFFSPSLKAEMPDPSRLKGMDDAVRKFCDAIEAGKSIAVYSDYDVDGATSAAIVLRWIRAVGSDAVYYIPDRMTEGYGLNSAAITKLRNEVGVEFILFLDAGTTAHEPLATAEALGLESVVIDHHDPDEMRRDLENGKPENGYLVPCPREVGIPATLVNPKRPDEDRAFEYLCTAGLAFLFLVGVNREMRKRAFFNDERMEPDLKKWLGIVALGTVADVMPLVGLNRAYVALGLGRMDEIPGLRALNVANGDVGYTTRTCGFKYGPCINAAGRIGNTRTGTLLLATDNLKEADETAQLLVETNEERKAITKVAVDEAISRLEEFKDDAVMVIGDENWHPGIVGLVASRVKDRMGRPAVIIGQDGKSSCRSIEGFDIGAAVIAAFKAGILVKGGGHAMAAGLTVAQDRISDLRAFLCEKAEGFVRPPVQVDVALKCGELSPSMVEAFARMAPFDQKDNPEPVVAIHSGWVKSVRILKERHVKLFLAGEHGETEAFLAFGVGTPLGDALAKSDDKFVDIYGTLEINEYGGKRRAVVKIEDAMILDDESSIAA
ncbi:single-stranded-DNA-specific exonuclease RecJ [Agrobacterium rubi]|nr:single-stranded-DNA-specific exonuclease RecJ [Agrobacterium rubi]NTF24497.1 single-stranded-DNA-specific exonuclease RecJ [Agrobacterium rubi]